MVTMEVALTLCPNESIQERQLSSLGQPWYSALHTKPFLIGPYMNLNCISVPCSGLNLESYVMHGSCPPQAQNKRDNNYKHSWNMAWVHVCHICICSHMWVNEHTGK
jgi:hypothetical protein